MSLFGANTKCEYCGKNPGFDPKVPELWYGFYDTDMDVYVCQHCRYVHYNRKKERGMGHFAERPVTIDGNVKPKHTIS